jgi:hypothetical protein
MTAGKATALTAAFVGAFALGVAVGPSITEKMSRHEPSSATVQPEQPAAEPAPARAEPQRRSTSRARTTATARKAAAPSAVPSETAAPTAAVTVSEPRLHARLKPVLNRGARMEVASEGFRSAEEFATVAHAARNTDVPFMLLKHRVVIEGRSLADAIHESKPELDAQAEVQRAQAAAKSDIDAIAG